MRGGAMLIGVSGRLRRSRSIFRLAQVRCVGHDFRVELKHLRHFVAIADDGGITAAARHLGLTQPALSRQVKALEEDLGVTLLDRGARSFSLTPAAETLLVDARKLLEFCDAMGHRVRAAAGGLPLRIGYSPSLAGDFLPFAIESFTQLHPGVRVSLHDATSLEMQHALLGGKLDLMVTVPCGTADAIGWTPLRECGWRLALSPRHRLAESPAVTPSDLSSERLLLYDRQEYPDYWTRVTAYFREHGIQAKIAGEFDGVASLEAAVEANLGCAIVAETSRLASSGGERILALRMDPQPEPILVAAGIAARHTVPDHVLAFIEEMKIHARVSRVV
jgi:LysR family transcriptional regulator, benzoate and cis,cis-muconate-responsive activator of ben and cat genes